MAADVDQTSFCQGREGADDGVRAVIVDNRVGAVDDGGVAEIDVEGGIIEIDVADDVDLVVLGADSSAVELDVDLVVGVEEADGVAQGEHAGGAAGGPGAERGVALQADAIVRVGIIAGDGPGAGHDGGGDVHAIIGRVHRTVDFQGAGKEIDVPAEGTAQIHRAVQDGASGTLEAKIAVARVHRNVAVKPERAAGGLEVVAGIRAGVTQEDVAGPDIVVGRRDKPTGRHRKPFACNGDVFQAQGGVVGD